MRSTRTAARLGWVDALRGVAAVAVAVHHATFVYTPHVRAAMLGWFNPGLWGVMVFFLVSGYIIPASLERHGDLSRFWLSRFFRIYPLWGLAAFFLGIFALCGVSPIRGELNRLDPVTAVLAHMTMVPDLLVVPNAINVVWTLSYEMAFYLIVAALFAFGWQSHSGRVAAGLVLSGVLLGSLGSLTLLTRTLGGPSAVLVTVAVMTIAIGAAYVGGSIRARRGVLAGGVLALALVVLNGRLSAWYGLSILAVMFTGTVLYRAEHRQTRRRTAALICSVVLVAVIAQGWWHPEGARAARSVGRSRWWGPPWRSASGWPRGPRRSPVRCAGSD